MARTHKELPAGTKFHNWTILERAPNRGSKAYYKCQCICGFVSSEVNLSKMKLGLSKSCGCLREEVQRKLRTGRKRKKIESHSDSDLRYGKWEFYEKKKGRRLKTSIIGRYFGYLKVLSYSHSEEKPNKRGKKTFWRCSCDICGNESVLEQGNIVSGNSVSCGCRRGIQQRIAEDTGLSSSTISLILHGKRLGDFRQETIKRVMESAKKIGYYSSNVGGLVGRN